MKIAVLDNRPTAGDSLHQLVRDAIDDALVLSYARVQSLQHAMRLQRIDLVVLDTNLCSLHGLTTLVCDLKRHYPSLQVVLANPTASRAKQMDAAARGADASIFEDDKREASMATLASCARKARIAQPPRPREIRYDAVGAAPRRALPV